MKMQHGDGFVRFTQDGGSDDEVVDILSAMRGQCDRYRTALEQITALPAVRQDECSEIARKALAEGE